MTLASRVLFIGAGRPWLGGAGYLLRQRVFVRALTDVADELHLAMFDAPADAAPPPGVAAVTPLPMPARRRRGRLAAAWADRAMSLPRSIRDFDPSAPRAAVAALNPAAFDAVVAFRIDNAHFAGVLGHRRLVLDIDDPEHVRTRRRLAANPDLADPGSQRDLVRLAAFERDAQAGAALSFVCQSGDAHGWRTEPEVVPNTVDLPPAPARLDRGPIVLFVGNARGTVRNANVDGVGWFLADVWPAVRAAVPAAEFHMVGPTDGPLRDRLAATPGVVARGFVDDLAGAYASAAVAVAPIRFGTGTRVKILEAFAHACPVVSTPIGAEGIAAVPGREIEMGVTAADMAARVVAMLCDRQAAERIGAAGRALAGRAYDAADQRHRLAGRLRRFLGR